MARIVQSLTQPLPEYDQQVQQSFVRDVILWYKNLTQRFNKI